MNNTSVLDKKVEGRGEPFFWHTRPTAEQVQLIATTKQEPVASTCWQEPVLQEEELFPEEVKKPILPVSRYSIPVVGALPTYRSYRNTQF